MTTGKILGDNYVRNGVSAAISGFVPDMSADIYYEVIRLIEGKLLFLPEHLERLRASLSESAIHYPGEQRIEEHLRLLLAENPFRNGNIRICVQQSPGKEPVLQCYFISYFYPDTMMYKNGVRLVSYPHQRPNPGIKKWDNAFRSAVGQYIRDHQVYEALLLNPASQITEGSRSNIFFIDPVGSLLTVPEKHVLPGITRRHVLEIATKEGIRFREKTISIDELDGLDAAFISGTSPKVLPVKQIDNFNFDVNHPILKLLMDRFDRLISKRLTLLLLVLALSVIAINAQQKRIYHSAGSEIIFSGADMNFNGTDVSTNLRFTLFFHTQQQLNIDLTNNIGLYTGLAIRNVGLIMEDYFQNVGYDVDNTHPDFNKNTKIKHRSYSLGFPFAFKVGSFSKNYFVYAGGEYEWMFHYKQKKFIDEEKYKFTEWTSDRVNPWIPSLFAGIQFPGGFNLKFKYYMDDFLNKDFRGQDFGQDVDYSQFESSGIWYISISVFISKQTINRVMEGQAYQKTAYR